MTIRILVVVLAHLLAGCHASHSPAPAAAKGLTYACDDGRTVQAAYPDTQTAEPTLDGQTHRLQIAISGSGARYIGDGWQWWSKGMQQAWIAPLKASESYASATGVSCRAP